MSRAALSLGLAIQLAAAVAVAAGSDPHLDPSLVLTSCGACHLGHGVSRSPMLPDSQTRVCLDCHDSAAKTDRLVGLGVLAADARPPLLASALLQPFTHPLTDTAFSRHEPSVLTCSSCHTPHRSMAEEPSSEQPLGRRKLSSRDSSRFEFELCQSCHGASGVTTQSLYDVSRQTSPNNRSYHPIEATSIESSPSLVSGLSGREINCSDCHGNSDKTGARGPHGSAVNHLLRLEYVTVDGSTESAETYALCYQCHDRGSLLEASPFPGHEVHIREARASCATCHSAHGSVENRALIRFGEETIVAGVGPSMSTGRLAFESPGPGAGSCYLTCHGVDHGPKTYGGFDSGLEAALSIVPPVVGTPEPAPRPVRRERPPDGNRNDR